MGEEGRETWLQLLKDFISQTTFHGWRYLAEDTVFFLRRIIWFCLCGTALGFFVFLVSDRLVYLRKFPGSTSIEVIYNDSITFPSVTVCNQNFFKKSAVHKNGMYDVIQDSFDTSSSTDIQAMFTQYDDKYLEGLDQATYYSYTHITLNLCTYICQNLNDEQCCSIVYFQGSGNCFISPIEPSKTRFVTAKSKPGAKYLQRTSCTLSSTLSCDFEQDMCSFVDVKTGAWKWEHDIAGNSQNLEPKIDHTYANESGSYMRAHLQYRLNEPAEFFSRDLLILENSCLEFYYQVISGTLQVNLTRTQIWKLNRRPTKVWERATVKLESGYHQIKFLATWDDYSDDVHIAVDDITVEPCQPEKECKTTITGLGYEGTMNTSARGAPCQRWDARDAYFQLWTENITDGFLSENFCRNPDGDVYPWCFINHRTGESEYCDIPVCECSGQFSFLCDVNKCIHREQVCDGYLDCNDQSDELRCANVTVSGSYLGITQDKGISVNCSFDQGGCGYQIPDLSIGQWKIEKTEPFYVSLDATSAQDREGGIAIIAAPPMLITRPHCLEVVLKLAYSRIDIFIVRYVQSLISTYITTIFPTPSERDFPGRGLSDIVHIDLPFNQTNISLHPILEQSLPECSQVTIETTTYAPEITTKGANFTLESNMTTPDVNVTDDPNYETQSLINTMPTVGKLIRRKRDEKLDFENPDGEITNKDLVYDTITKTDIYFQETNNSSDVNQTTLIWLNMTEAPPTGFELIHPVANESECQTCAKPLSSRHLPNCFQPDGITCNFDDGCGCGYTYVTTNVDDFWDIYHPGQDNMTDPNKGREDYDMYARSVAKPQRDDKTFLMSPIQTVDRVSCLHFLYITKYANVTVKQYSFTFTRKLLEISIDQQAMYWHRALVTVEPNTFGISFEFNYDDNAENGQVGIDDVVLRNGACSQTVAGGSVNCSFDDFDICGYKDASPTSMNWFRSKGSNESPGTQYYMRTRKTSEGKMSRKLMSPAFEVDEDSCLEFWYFMQSYRIDNLATFAASLVRPTDTTTAAQTNKTELIWLVRSISDNLWHKASAIVKTGNYEGLVFEINGDEYRGGVAEIFIKPGQCPPLVCIETEEFKCEKSGVYAACIPPTVKCNGLPNCDFGLDEDHDLNCTVIPFTSVWQDVELLTGEGYRASVATNQSLPDISLTEMYRNLGPSKNDFIHSCDLESNVCEKWMFQQQITDYGLCYTFNPNKTIRLGTSATGATSGLSLVMNIESYEYMVGPNSDAGIKMFLHPITEVPRVRDLGFAVAPGTHTLVGIERNEANNLQDPWGDCGETSLEFYSVYDFSACQMECSTQKLNHTCSCRDAYMPNNTDGYPELCTVEQYFSCVVDYSYKGQAKDLNMTCKECPKPCSQVVYEGSLSHALLSDLGVSIILEVEGSKARLEDNLKNAMAADDRVSTSFVDTISKGETLISLFRSLLTMTDRNFADRRDTAFRMALMASKAMVNTAIRDVDILFADVAKQRNSFNNLFKQSYDVFDKILIDLELYLKTIEELQNLPLFGGVSDSESLKVIVSKALVDTRIAEQTLDIMMLKYHNSSLAVKAYTESSTQEAYLAILPEKYFLDTPSCINYSRNLVDTLREIRPVLESLTKDPSVDLNARLNSLIVKFIKERSETHGCFSEYLTLLDEIMQWQSKWKDTLGDISDDKSAVAAMDELFRKTTNGKSRIAVVEADFKQAKEATQGFMNDKLTKAETLIKLAEDESTKQERYSKIKAFLTYIKTKVSGPISSQVDSVITKLGNYYLEALKKAAALEEYLGYNYFQSKNKLAKMLIWKEPSLNRKDLTQVKDGGIELWTFWSSTMDVAEGLSSGLAIEHINIGLDKYFDPITDVLDRFTNDLNDLELKFANHFGDIEDSSQNYQKRLKIDHQFMLDNFMTVDVYFKQLKYQQVNQTIAYDILAFFGDFGGYLGLMMGGSVLSVFELLDFCFYNGLRRGCHKDRKRPKENGRNGQPGGALEVDNKGYRTSANDVQVEAGASDKY